jgi:hypothetical protein
MWANIKKKLAYSIAEWCDETDLGRTFTYGEISEGKLIARKAGGRTIILYADAIDYLSNLPTLKRVDGDSDVDDRAVHSASHISSNQEIGPDEARVGRADQSYVRAPRAPPDQNNSMDPTTEKAAYAAPIEDE